MVTDHRQLTVHELAREGLENVQSVHGEQHQYPIKVNSLTPSSSQRQAVLLGLLYRPRGMSLLRFAIKDEDIFMASSHFFTMTHMKRIIELLSQDNTQDNLKRVNLPKS